jgi:hypothetical protein
MSKKHPSLPAALKTLLKEPTFPKRKSARQAGIVLPAGRAATPLSAPPQSELHKTFDRIANDANSKGLGWGEWMSLAVGHAQSSSL